MHITKSWSLFLDRDGVINRRLPGEYVQSPTDFDFIPGVLKSIKEFSRFFGKIFVITNQQGIGKGKMTIEDLNLVHSFMLEKIHESGGRIDGVYFCPHLASEGCDCRKPKIGMALQAKQAFPEINFNQSIMVGDSFSDMQFAKGVGMLAVYIKGKEGESCDLFDYEADSLDEFAKSLEY